MAIDFPNSPTNGQTTTVGNTTYVYNSTVGAWEILSSGGIGTMTTKGDLLSRSSTGLARVPTGTNDYVLTADSSATPGLSWGASPKIVANSAARPSSPFQGQLIYQTDTNQLLLWNGSTWVIPNTPVQNPTGLELISRYVLNNTNRALVCDNVFNSTYSNYRVIGKVRSNVSTNGFFFQMLNSSGTSLATNYYSTAYGLDYAGAGTTWYTNSLTTVAYVGWIPSSSDYYLSFAFDIYGPAIAADSTTWNGNHTGISSGAWYSGGFMVGGRTIPDANRGLRFDNGGGGNLIGAISIFGYRD